MLPHFQHLCWYNHSPGRPWAAEHGWGCRMSLSLLGNAFLPSALSSFLIHSYLHRITPHSSNDYTVLTQTERQLLSTPSLQKEKKKKRIKLVWLNNAPSLRHVLFWYLILHSVCLIFYFPQSMIQKLPPSLGFEDRKSSGAASESDPFFSSWLLSMRWKCIMCSPPSSGAPWGSTCSILPSGAHLRSLLAQGSLQPKAKRDPQQVFLISLTTLPSDYNEDQCKKY